MSAEIVTWLRGEADAAAHQPPPWKMLAAAADEIERQQAIIDNLRDMLKEAQEHNRLLGLCVKDCAEKLNDAKNRNVRLLSQLQEYEAREQ